MMSDSPEVPELPEQQFMQRAIELAERGAGQVAPNPKVGAVVVRDGRVVGEGWHRSYGSAHAEVEALAAAGDAARGATVYVSLEPCNHHGKTPPCTDALITAGVARVVFATRDPNPRAAGGMEKLSAAGIVVEGGLCEREARTANAAFLHYARSLAVPSDPASLLPFVELKLAVSVDGAIAPASRTRLSLTGAGAQAAVHAMRAASDAVAVGIGTAIADDPALTVRLAPTPRVPPRRVVFDHAARLPLDSVLVRTAHELPVLMVSDGADPQAVAARASFGVVNVDASDLRQGLARLRELGVNHLFVEGGAGLASALLADGLVHHLIIFQAPVILGADALPAFASLPVFDSGGPLRLKVLERRTFGDDLMTRYAVSGD